MHLLTTTLDVSRTATKNIPKCLKCFRRIVRTSIYHPKAEKKIIYEIERIFFQHLHAVWFTAHWLGAYENSGEEARVNPDSLSKSLLSWSFLCNSSIIRGVSLSVCVCTGIKVYDIPHSRGGGGSQIRTMGALRAYTQNCVIRTRLW